MFYSHIKYYTSDIDQKRIQLISYIDEFFDPTDEDAYYIMDPYLEIDKSIQTPCFENKLEGENWSYLLSILAYNNVEFNIITRENIDSIISSKNDPPFDVPVKNLNGAIINVCRYIDSKHFGLCIHDRYIIQKRNEEVRALHFGPSLADINDKDVSVTVYSKEGALNALNNFENLWDACITNKGWKKG